MSNSAYPVVAEDAFEAARRKFFRGEGGNAAALNNRTVFTQTKTYDGPVPEHVTPKSSPSAVTVSSR